MEMLEHWNAAIAYIERNLCTECDPGRAAAGIACVTEDSFLRFFSYMTGMTLSQYIRRRRLTLAAQEMRESTLRVIDIAVKYGYDSADAFSRAFAKQHGATPAAYRKNGGWLKVYPPVSFHITVKGAVEMDCRMMESPGIEAFGVSKRFDGQGYPTREALRHIMWDRDCENVPGQICEGEWNQPGNTAYDGVWYGIWRDGNYMIAREKKETQNRRLESQRLPAGTYAAFRTKRGGLVWEEFPKLFALAFDSWLPPSGYRQKGDLAIEVLHLWTDRSLRQANRYYELWVPVEKLP